MPAHSPATGSPGQVSPYCLVPLLGPPHFTQPRHDSAGDLPGSVSGGGHSSGCTNPDFLGGAALQLPADVSAPPGWELKEDRDRDGVIQSCLLLRPSTQLTLALPCHFRNRMEPEPAALIT